MISIGIVDDHKLVRRGLRTMIESWEGFAVIMEADNGKEALSLLQNGIRPDIVLTDIMMPIMNGYDLIKSIKISYSAIYVIAITCLKNENVIYNVLNIGAVGYIGKEEYPMIIKQALTNVFQNGSYPQPKLPTHVLANTNSLSKRYIFFGKEYLTSNEVKFLKYCATDYGYKEIAILMNVSEKTIENYRDSLYKKLNVHTRSALALFAISTGNVSIF